MYITYKGNNYPCLRLKKVGGGGVSYRGLPVDFPAPIEGEMTLYADDGFEMRTEKAEDWLRQTFRGGILTFTNTPEPVPEPEPEPIPEGDEPVTWDELAEAYKEGVNSIDE